MADAIETRSISQLARMVAVPTGAIVPLQVEGEPAGGVPVEALFGKYLSVAISYETAAELLVDLDHDDQSVALVYADPDPANSIYWVKNGASGAGGWTKTNIGQGLTGDTGPANSSYATTAALEAAAVTNVSAILAETGKAGTFTIRDYADFIPEVAADAGKVNYIRSTTVPAKVWVRTSILSQGAAQIGIKRPEAGAVGRTVYDELRDIISRSGYATLTDAWAAAGFKPLFDPTTGALYLTADSAPLNYATSRAKFVYQHRDTADGGTNELIPAAVFQFNATGNGTVNSSIELSQTIWSGQFNYMRKSGDGSAHTFTSIGELSTVGPGGYNELGMFQGEATNTGSAKGTMSGVEMLLKDSSDGGGTTHSTKMQAIVGRIAKYNPTTRKSHNFIASSEGSLPPDAILGGNSGGLASWLRGFDFQGLTFTTGQFGLAPNNTFLAWLKAGGASAPVIGVNNADDVFIAATSASNRVNITNSSFATRFAVDQDTSNAVLLWVGGSLKRVTEGSADSAGTGYKQLRVAN